MADGSSTSTSGSRERTGFGHRLPPLFDDKSRYLDRFGVQLGLVVITVVILALVDLSEPESQFRARVGIVGGFVLVVLTLLLSLRASGVANRWALVADVVALVAVSVIIFLNIVDSVSGIRLRATPAPILISLLAMITPIVVIRRLLQHREINRGTLLGAVSAYLLIGVTYYFVFLSLSEIQSEPFFGKHVSTTAYMYFSLTTITTTGYGDYTAQTDMGRLLSNSEAVIGQIYLVTFVALLVGLYASSRHQRFLTALPEEPEPVEPTSAE